MPKKLKWPFSEERKHYLTLKKVISYESDAKNLPKNVTSRTSFTHGSFLRSAINPDSYHFKQYGKWTVTLADRTVQVNPKVGSLKIDSFRSSKGEYEQMVVSVNLYDCTEMSIYFGLSGEPCKRGDLPCCKLT